jgi:hypothetical protein
MSQKTIASPSFGAKLLFGQVLPRKPEIADRFEEVTRYRFGTSNAKPSASAVAIGSPPNDAAEHFSVGAFSTVKTCICEMTLIGLE